MTNDGAGAIRDMVKTQPKCSVFATGVGHASRNSRSQGWATGQIEVAWTQNHIFLHVRDIHQSSIPFV
jgi:hypothetical protein